MEVFEKKSNNSSDVFPHKNHMGKNENPDDKKTTL